jgi:outer membrane murein-binding lipoprotein Lpp
MEAISRMIETKRSFARLPAVAAAVLGGLALSACATTQYVDQRIAEVNTHIAAVDAKATAAGQTADQALSVAQAAQAAAAQDSQRIDSLTATVNGLQQAPPPPPPPARTPRG